MRLGRKASLTLLGIAVLTVYGVLLIVLKRITDAQLATIVGGMVALITQYTVGNVSQRRNGVSGEQHPENHIS